MNAVPQVKYVVIQSLGKRIELAALFAFSKESQPCGEVTQSHYDQSGAVLPGASGHAAHAFTAVPDGIALQQGLDGVVVSGLDDGNDLPGVVTVELSRRTNGGTGSTVDARMEYLLETVILF